MPAPQARPAGERPTSAPPEDLDDRKVRILRTIVAEYVAQAAPVGSRHVVELAGLDVSSATVRNEMAALEDAGYLAQPHTSAGRVPTDKGYRFFVDDLRRRQTVDPVRRETVAELLGSVTSLEELLVRSTQALTQLTHLVSLVTAPVVDTSRLKLVELVDLTPRAVLILLVTDAGHVEKRLIELRSAATPGDLRRARSVVNENLHGRRLREVPDLLEGLADEAPAELRELLEGVSAVAGEGSEERILDRVLVGGTASLAGQPGIGREQLSRVLALLEERVTLARLLTEAATEGEPTVRIGAEHDVEGLQPTALVAQRYRLLTAGSVGVLGPTRMDYAGVLGTVRAVADQLQASLRDLDEA